MDSLRYEETGDDNDDEDDDLEDDNSEDVDPREEQFVRSRMSEVAALQSVCFNGPPVSTIDILNDISTANQTV